MTFRLDSVRRIWDDAPHNAFTGLARLGGSSICVFREGDQHASPDGRIRVIASDDGEQWRSRATFTSPLPDRPDLRDPKVAVGPDGRLHLLTCARNFGAPADFQPLAAQSADGAEWSELAPVVEPGLWLWGLAASADALHGLAYGPARGRTPDAGVVLFTDAGRGFERTAVMHAAGEHMGEPAGAFAGGEAVVLCRRSSPAVMGLSAWIGTSTAPYRDWRWRDTGVHVGGPAVLRTPGGDYFAAGRHLDPEHRTAVWRLDPELGVLTDQLVLPSGGDTSYPGLVWHGQRLWVSYYSSHEGKTAIYFAAIATD